MRFDSARSFKITLSIPQRKGMGLTTHAFFVTINIRQWLAEPRRKNMQYHILLANTNESTHAFHAGSSDEMNQLMVKFLEKHNDKEVTFSSLTYNLHVLSNGATVVTTSPHSFKFSDGTEAPPQNEEFCKYFTLQKNFQVLREVQGMKITKTSFVLSKPQIDCLNIVSYNCSIVLVPFPVLQTLKEGNHFYSNVVAFNSTPDTSRSPIDQKVVDINNWSGV